MSIGLHYTGYPFVDVGVAAITAFVQKTRIEDVSLDDLIQAADYLKDVYSNIKVVQGQLTTLFPNSGFTQPSYSKEQKLDYSNTMFYGFMPGVSKLDVACSFFPDKRAYLYAHRQFVPLLSPDGTINFLPEGRRMGIPVSGEALLAIAAVLLGSFRCKNWLVFHEVSPSNNVDLTLIMAREAMKTNTQMIELLRGEPENKWTTLKKPRQVYIDKILAAQTQINRRNAHLGNMTGYHFSNYGPNPDLEVIRLESSVWDFISTARYDAEAAWGRFLALGQVDKEYNRAYDALFDLPYQYNRFMELLKQVADWNFTEIFLRKVVKMNQRRIHLLKELGDRLVSYINTHERDGKGRIKFGFYYKFARTNKPGEFRTLIIEACDTAYRKGNQTLITTDEYVLAFESPEDRYESWTLARDLITMRIIEGLVALGVSPEEREAAEEELKAQIDAQTVETE
jgi:CRISPR-associated protein Cst1